MKKTIVILSYIMLISALAACSNTWDGAGKDTENIGRWMQETVN